jgi:cytochrome c oxidase assembly protein subunit 15
MDATPLYDLQPLARLMLLGMAVAVLPLAWVWWRHRHAPVSQRLQALTWVTLFLTFDLVLFGAFTRLTDSGLGCPDWPGCYGAASPVGAHADIAAAQQAMPTGPVTFPKAWIEMIHRYLATGVGVLIIVLLAGAWAERRRLKVPLFWPVLTLVWVCVQGAFGALTVTMKLFPAIVTLHLLGGLALLALLRVQSVAYAIPAHTPPLPARVQRWLWLAFTLVWAQVALGGWVSTNYAVLACTDFPTCQGSWWPVMDGSGFSVWRDLGHTAAGEPLPFAALTAIHYTHRLAAYLVLAVLVVVALVLQRAPGWRTESHWLLGLSALQLLTGLSNVVLGWPLLAAVMHTGGAAALVLVLTGALARRHFEHVVKPQAVATPTPRFSGQMS